jgi:hypothetical protein
MSVRVVVFRGRPEIDADLARLISREPSQTARRTSGTSYLSASIASECSVGSEIRGLSIHRLRPEIARPGPISSTPAASGIAGIAYVTPAPVGRSPRCSRYTSARCRARRATPGIARAVAREPGSWPSIHPRFLRGARSRIRPVTDRRGVLHERSTMAGPAALPPSRIAAWSRRPCESARTMRGQTSRDRDPPPRRVPQESFLESSPVRSPLFDRCRGRPIRSGESGGLLWVLCGPRLDSRLRSPTRGRTRRPAFPQNAPLRVLQESLSI